MSLAPFLIDAQLSPTLVQKLKEAGIDAVHVHRLGLAGGSDQGIWTRASALGAVIVTKDQDFVALARRTRGGPAVVHVRLGNVSNDELWLRLSAALDDIRTCLARGDAVVEIIR